MPIWLELRATAVAVVRSAGGNQAEDRRAGVHWNMGWERPIRTEPKKTPEASKVAEESPRREVKELGLLGQSKPD